MTRNFLTAGIFILGIVFTLPVFAQNQDAVQPKQELGTQPPVLTDFDPLSDDELKDGWIRLFDGISLYGWRPQTGKYTVQKKILVSASKHDTIQSTGIFPNSIVTFEQRPANSDGNWSPFTLNTKTSKPDQAGIPGIMLGTGQFRNVKLQPQNMKPIFDGKTLSGWTVQGKAEAKVENGVIHLTGGSGSLESEGKYADFVLQLEYKTGKPVNSGVFFRCIPGEVMNGYECQVFNHPPADDYKKFIGTDTGGIFRRQVGRNAGAKDGQWNYLTIFVRDSQISAWVNGIQTADWLDDRAPDPNPRKGKRTEAGTIQFQGHDATTDILFRNIRIGEL